MKFTVNPLQSRIVFGAGTAAQLADEVAALGGTRVMIVCTPGAAGRVQPLAESLGDACAGIFDGVETHVPLAVVEAAIDKFRSLDADCLVTFGGGSSVDTGKPITVETGKPAIAIPTTYSGAEMTPNYGIVIDGAKKRHQDPRAQARTVIYDPALTTGLPPHMTATSGMNGLAHCVEALYPAQPHPVAALLAEEAARALAAGLPGSIADADDLDARGQALYGAYLGGTVVTLVGIALHHRTCHVLGGTYGLAHGEANSVILPQVTAFNAPAAPQAMAALARALGTDDPAAAIFDLGQSIGAPSDLKSIGMNEGDLDAVATQAIEFTAYNPQPLEFGPVREMLQNAYEGNRPSAPI
jgi:alcohol dehydrogenase class IV